MLGMAAGDTGSGRGYIRASGRGRMSGTVASVRSQHRGGYPRVLAPLLATHLCVLCLCNGVERAFAKTLIVSAGVGASRSGANTDCVGGRWWLLACGYHPCSPPLTFMLYVFATATSPCPQRHCSCRRASAGNHASGNGRMSDTAAGGGGQHRGGIHGYHSRSPPPTLMLYIFVKASSACMRRR